MDSDYFLSAREAYTKMKAKVIEESTKDLDSTIIGTRDRKNGRRVRWERHFRSRASFAMAYGSGPERLEQIVEKMLKVDTESIYPVPKGHVQIVRDFGQILRSQILKASHTKVFISHMGRSRKLTDTNTHMERKEMLLKINVKKLLAALRSQAEANATKHQNGLDVYNEKLGEFTSIAAANGMAKSNAESALTHLGITKPHGQPELFTPTIKMLEMVESETIDITEESDLYTMFNDLK